MDNNTIDKMAEKYSNIEELRAYCNAQYRTILKLTKRLSKAEKDANELKEQLSERPSQYALIDNPAGISDEEAICYMELKRLRDTSFSRELTIEECRKVETYVRTLNTIKNQQSKKDNRLDEFKTEDLENWLNSIESNEKLVNDSED